MKKLVLLFAAAAMAVSASAQTVTESNTFDNFYIGLNGGVAMKTTGYNKLKNLDPNAGLRIGRYFTPVFGLAIESNAYFSNKPWASTGTAVRYINTSLLGTVNLSNWFGGYLGEPRLFEVSALYGFGWGHLFGTPNNTTYNAIPQANNITSKVGIDFAFNLGKAKAWQVYIEPSITYPLNGNGFSHDVVQYNVNKSFMQLNAGIVYKFKNSNGTHNFTIAQLRDQSEIDGLNAKINELRGNLNDKDSQLAAKDKRIAELKKALEECNNKPVATGNLLPTVLFRQNYSTIDANQFVSIEQVAKYMQENPNANVEIKGYASPEGPADVNQKLSELRANAVKDALVKKYNISADRLTATGMGATDKLFEQVEFNRVATFDNGNK